MNKLNFSKKALKFLETLDAKQYRQIARKIFSLLTEAYPNDSEELKGCSDYFRVDAGEYRIIYTIEGGIVMIVLIGNRNDGAVYREFERKLKSLKQYVN